MLKAATVSCFRFFLVVLSSRFLSHPRTFEIRRNLYIKNLFLRQECICLFCENTQLNRRRSSLWLYDRLKHTLNPTNRAESSHKIWVFGSTVVPSTPSKYRWPFKGLQTPTNRDKFAPFLKPNRRVRPLQYGQSRQNRGYWGGAD